MSETRRNKVGAKSEVRWEVLSGADLRSHALRVKRDIAVSRLAFARECGDAAMVARETARLAQINEWEAQS